MESFVLVLSKVMKCFDSGLIFTIPASSCIISVSSTIISYGILMSSTTKWELISEMHVSEEQMNKTYASLIKGCFVFCHTSVAWLKEIKYINHKCISDHRCHSEEAMVNA